MITSKDIELMSNAEFDKFQQNERKEIAKQLNIEYTSDVMLQCGVCKHKFLIISYCNVKCPNCNTHMDFKKELIGKLKMLENIDNIKSN